MKNIGQRAGEEVAQLYLRDEYASVVQPLQQLKKYERFFLNPGDEKRVTFTLSDEDFSLVDKEWKCVVEPGTFHLMIGAASDDIRLKGKIDIKR